MLLDEIKHKRENLTANKRNLYVYEQQAAKFGSLHVPPYLVNEIEDLKRQIDNLEREIAEKLPAADSEILALFAECFDRPVFNTRFSRESNIPDFKKAISDTIEALNTGIRRTRDGIEIKRIPSRHDIQDSNIRDTLSTITDKLVQLRAKYDRFIVTKDIRSIGNQELDHQYYVLSEKACKVMDDKVKEILDLFRYLYPEFRLL